MARKEEVEVTEERTKYISAYIYEEDRHSQCGELLFSSARNDDGHRVPIR